MRVALLLHPLLSLTHWIFGSLMLPYKSSSHSASSAVTDSLDSQVALLPYESSSHSASTAVTDSLDFQVALLPYKSSSHSAKCVRCASLPLKGQGQRVQRVQKVQRVQRGRIAAEGGNDFICRLTAASGKRIADSRPTVSLVHQLTSSLAHQPTFPHIKKP